MRLRKLTRSLIACLAASFIAGCANQDYVAGPVYELPGGAEAVFAAASSEISGGAADEIRRARRVAIFPALDGTDEATVAEARRATGVSVISAKRTVDWAQREGFPEINARQGPTDPALLQRFASDLRADLAVNTRITSNPALITAVVGAPLVMGLETVFVSARTGQVLWKEQEELRLKLGSGETKPEYINIAIIRGVADAFNQIRGR